MIRRFPVFRSLSILVLMGGIVYLEIARPFGAFRLGTFVLLALLVGVLTSFARGIWRDGLLIVASLLFGICAIEAFATIVSPAWDIRTTHGFTVPEPVIGWGPQHPGVFHATRFDPRSKRVIYDANYSINSDLIRPTRACKAGPTVAFFGDSFTFGQGVNDSETVPQYFSDAFGDNLRVLNLGFPGYGPQQFLRELETGYFDRLVGPQPKLFVFMTTSWHVVRSSCKASWVMDGPRYGLAGDKVAYQGVCDMGLARWLKQWAQHSATYRLFIEPRLEKINHADVDLFIRMTLAAIDLAKAKYGVPTLIPFIRAPEDYLRPTGFSNDDIIRRLRGGGADVIDVSLDKQKSAGEPVIIQGDDHATGLGNHLRAAWLKDYIAQHYGTALLLASDGTAPICARAK
ncbi:MAG: SGNH/GDSL hydrolase family protein [Methylovirgula sp.]|uniref:SGNH/GDSL hydrolase family protein n=1 Tax=Methylovirgula sp. TaxID=1978224 RepID=UPI0030762953